MSTAQPPPQERFVETLCYAMEYLAQELERSGIVVNYGVDQLTSMAEVVRLTPPEESIGVFIKHGMTHWPHLDGDAKKVEDYFLDNCDQIFPTDNQLLLQDFKTVMVASDAQFRSNMLKSIRAMVKQAIQHYGLTNGWGEVDELATRFKVNRPV